MKKTKILHIQRSFITCGLTEDLLKYIQSSQGSFDHTVLVHYQPGGEKEARDNHYVHALEKMHVPVLFAQVTDPQEPTACAVVKSVLDQHNVKADAVHSWMTDETQLAKKIADGMGAACIPIFGTAHDLHTGNERLRKSVEASRIALEASPDPYICVSGNILDTCRDQYKFPVGRARQVDDGTDEKRFLRSAYVRRDMRNELHISQHATVVGMAARFDRYKDPKGFLLVAGQLLKKRPDAHFLLAGGGMEAGNAQLQAMIQETEALLGMKFGDRLHLLGERKDMERVYNAMDMYLHTAVSESFGLAPVEAKACGVPVAVTRGGKQLPITAGTTIGLGDAIVHDVRESQAELIKHMHRKTPLPDPQQTASYDRQWSQSFADAMDGRLTLLADPATKAIAGFEERMHMLDKYSFSRTAQGYMDVVREALQQRQAQAGRASQER